MLIDSSIAQAYIESSCVDAFRASWLFEHTSVSYASKSVSRVLYLTVIYLSAPLPVRFSHLGSGRAALLLPYRCCSG